MKKTLILLLSILCLSSKMNAGSYLHNEYAYLQDITFELYTDDVPAYKVPEQLKSIEETLMFEVLHATWKDKHWVAYTLNKNLLGTFKVGQPALSDNGNTKKIFFVATFPGSVGGLDLYTAEYKNGTWSKPKNLGNVVNTAKNESNPGLLNDNTLTYSSGGIIKKLDLRTFKVVDLEETIDKTETQSILQNKKEEDKKDVIAAIGDNSTATPAGTGIDNNVGAIGDNSSAMPVNSNDQSTGYSKSSTTQTNTFANTQQNGVSGRGNEVQQAPKIQMQTNSTNNTTEAKAPVVTAQNANVQSLGTQSRDAMLAKYKTAIQLGAFSAPKWDLIQPLSKYGKIVTYKNENGANVVWLTGFSNRAAAESVLPQVKATPGFENAYITGK
jgi:hypothetical protein